MTTSELIEQLQSQLRRNGDREIIVTANGRYYNSVSAVMYDNQSDEVCIEMEGEV